MKESNLVTTICEYLQVLENQGKLVFVRNNSGAVVVDKRFFRFGKKGSPDIFIFLEKGRVIHCECKTGKGRLNKNQINYQKKITKLEHEYWVVNSIDTIIKNIK